MADNKHAISDEDLKVAAGGQGSAQKMPEPRTSKKPEKNPIPGMPGGPAPMPEPGPRL